MGTYELDVGGSPQKNGKKGNKISLRESRREVNSK